MTLPKTKIDEPVLYSIPVIEKIKVTNRAEMLAQIASGALEYIDFDACVFVYGPNTNALTFNPDDLPAFAASFAGQPYLRNHDTWDIDARDGTITASVMDGDRMKQTVRLTTRRGMTDYVEGKMDRFSIGWYKDDVLCTICNQSWYSAGCSHWPGREYDTAAGKKTCLLLSVNPKGKETSAVNAPAVKSGTGLLQELQDYKLSINGDPAGDQAQGDKMKFPIPLFEADKGGGAGAPAPVAPPSSAAEQLEANTRAIATLTGETERQAALQSQLDKSNGILAAQCSQLLATALQLSRLPEIVQTRIKKQFEGKVFEAPALQAAIDEARAEVSALQGGSTVQGHARINSVYNSEDQIRAAMDDLLGAPRDAGSENLKVHKFDGIKDAYLKLTGDINFFGGFDPEFALGSTATFPGIVKDSQNKILTVAWDKYGELGYGWWKDVVSIEHFDNLNQIDWLRLGTIGSLPTVAEGAEYTELPIGDNVETSDWTKYGGYVGLTLEAVLRDDTRAFRKMPDQVALGAMRNISEQIAAIFTSNSAAGPTLADGGALFNSTAVTTAGGHANLLTTALGTDYTAWRAVSTAMYKQPMLIKNATGYYGIGKRQAVRPRFALVPADLADQATDLFISRQNPQDNKNFENHTFGKVLPRVVPEWTDATDWAAVADPRELPCLMLGEIFGVKPQIFVAGRETDPAMFANDESRIKVRQFLAVGVADFRGLHKSNVT